MKYALHLNSEIMSSEVDNVLASSVSTHASVTCPRCNYVTTACPGGLRIPAERMQRHCLAGRRADVLRISMVGVGTL